MPLLAAAFTAFGVAVFALQRKSLAQATCVRGASRLGKDLGKLLTELLGLNPQAERLRARRARAERRLRLARLTLLPVPIAVAEADRLRVVLQQATLGQRQRSILRWATAARLRHRAEFGAAARAMGGRNVTTTSGARRALAVTPDVPLDLAAVYRPDASFPKSQTQTFTLEVDVLPAFARRMIDHSVQRTRCATTLDRKDHAWHTQITAASARSNSRW